MHIIILEAPCMKRARDGISVWDIEETDIYNFLAELRNEGRYTPSVASVLYSSIFSKLQKGIIQLKSIGEEVLVYLVMPYGIVSGEDYVVNVKECFEELGIPELEILFERFHIKNRVYDIIEKDFDTAVICLNHKILRVLDLEYYLPATKPIVIVSDAHMTSKANVFMISPAHYLIRKIFKLSGYGPELCISVANYVLRSLHYLARQVGNKNFRELLRDPKTLFQTIFSQETIEILLGKKEQRLDLFVETDQ